MAREIVWTKRASNSFRRITNYLEYEFGEKTTRNFILRTFNVIDLLKANPEMGTIESFELGIFGFLITKHNRLFYRFSQLELILLNFFDTRSQRPKF
ncbi:Plasmid stabilization system protein ParE [Algoriphagus locisalis]|uniref:Plasmid stabilization system protein ParE n=1 Tax=Algoriphagus locisalis TaxID=305507 RepID=A0A1I7AQU5_9BACT|nr:type II toxin-antitoxin system RelE/ParE family toxin [Algoriphagus locisalis]SFT77284.1 Plasmid stabilization system protein ParE [Algoriphagus locisalis]